SRDRTFLFFAFEGLQQRLDQTLRGFVPSVSYRSQILSRMPVLAPLVNAYPVGTQSQANDPTTDLFIGLSPQKNQEASAMVRIDRRLSARTSPFLRWNIDRATSDVPLVNLKDRQTTPLKPMNGVFNVTQALSHSVLNESRVGFNQVLSRTINHTSLPLSLAVSGFTTLSSSRPKEEDGTLFSVIDTLSRTHDGHFIATGGEARRVFRDPGPSPDGTLPYASRDNFLANQLDSASLTATLPLKKLR